MKAIASIFVVSLALAAGCAASTPAPANASDSVRLMTPKTTQDLELRRVAMASSLAADHHGAASAELRVCVPWPTMDSPPLCL